MKVNVTIVIIQRQVRRSDGSTVTENEDVLLMVFNENFR